MGMSVGFEKEYEVCVVGAQGTGCFISMWSGEPPRNVPAQFAGQNIKLLQLTMMVTIVTNSDGAVAA
jgi:hypothetical protein